MNVSVLGCGRWGTFLAWYANRVGHNVMLWGREGSRKFAELEDVRKNDYLTLPAEVQLSNELEKVISFGEIIIISISAQELRSFGERISQFARIEDKIFVLCMKGIEASSGKRLSQVFQEQIGQDKKIGVWVGPGHVQDFVREIPNCMVIGSNNLTVTKTIVDTFNSNLIRFYYGKDLLGIEIGAAAKNVMGIAAGMLDGMNYSSLKGALMARGTRELSLLVEAMGGDATTIYGLSHLGDYEATLFSLHSHNRKYGEGLVKGEQFDKLAEGVSTVVALKKLAEKYKIELPICNAVYEIVIQRKEPKEKLLDLFLRPVKFEF
ncbi:MAG: Glycerol-3-phosphate dehydrogenase [Massilibacillus sp.]|nr:Glycerol-3-phosphate dehydrogenase [Massilibacillus sp.]